MTTPIAAAVEGDGAHLILHWKTEELRGVGDAGSCKDLMWLAVKYL